MTGKSQGLTYVEDTMTEKIKEYRQMYQDKELTYEQLKVLIQIEHLLEKVSRLEKEIA